MKLFPLLSLMFFMVGCATTTIPPKYTVATPDPTVTVQRDVSRVVVRMAADLRAYNQPLVFHADGTVSVYRGLNYYAPLEVAIERTLSDATTFAPGATATMRIVVQDFCVVEGPEGPVAKVTLSSGKTVKHATAALPTEYTTKEVRHALGELLLTVYGML